MDLIKVGLYIGTLSFYLFTGWLKAQSDTLYICNPGDPIQLNAPQGPFSYEWFPDFNLDNPTIANPTATTYTNQAYILKRIPLPGDDNLITNPSFTEGDLGFESEYPYNDVINFQGVYSVNESAFNLNPVYFSDCPDHTTGDGPMMVIDGSPISDVKVWCQSIPVTPNKQYAFSTWLASVNPSNPASLQFFINDEALGNPFRAVNAVCQWRQFFDTWNSDTATVAEICIINQNTNPQGNDFALDDFAFYEIPGVIIDTTVILVEAIAASPERRVYFPNAFSPNLDGINDLFFPHLGKGPTLIQAFRIFNRWGDLVFEQTNCLPNDRSCSWDGTFRNELLNPDLYTYMAQIKFADLSVEVFTGSVWLMR